MRLLLEKGLSVRLRLEFLARPQFLGVGSLVGIHVAAGVLLGDFAEVVV